MKKKLHKVGTTILLSLAPAALIGMVTGVVVANWPKAEAKPIVDPEMSGEVDIEVTTDGRGYTECKLTAKETSKQVASVVVKKGGVTLEETEYEWNKEGQYISISPDVMEQYPGQIVITPTLEDKETIEQKWFAKYQPISATYQSTVTTFKNEEVVVKINGVQTTIININNDIDDGCRSSSLDLQIPGQAGVIDSYYLSAPDYESLQEKVRNAKSKGFECTFEIKDDSLSLTIPGADNQYTKYVINNFGYILSYEEKNSIGALISFTADYHTEPHEVTEYCDYNVRDVSQYSPTMQLQQGVTYTITTNGFTEDDKFKYCGIISFYTYDPVVYHKLEVISVSGLDEGVTGQWYEQDDMYAIVFLKDGQMVESTVTNLEIKFKLKLGTGNVDDAWFRLMPENE